jgi:hypothetical protein
LIPHGKSFGFHVSGFWSREKILSHRLLEREIFFSFSQEIPTNEYNQLEKRFALAVSRPFGIGNGVSPASLTKMVPKGRWLGPLYNNSGKVYT